MHTDMHGRLMMRDKKMFIECSPFAGHSVYSLAGLSQYSYKMGTVSQITGKKRRGTFLKRADLSAQAPLTNSECLLCSRSSLATTISTE